MYCCEDCGDLTITHHTYDGKRLCKKCATFRKWCDGFTDDFSFEEVTS